MRYRSPGTLALLATLTGFVASSCIADGNATQNPELAGAAAADSESGGSAAESSESRGGAGGAFDEASSGAAGSTEPAKGGSGGSGGAQTPATGGSAARGGGEPAAAGEGGNGASGNAAGGEGGTTSTGAKGGSDDDGGEAGSAGGATGGSGSVDPPPALTVCDRLINPPENSFDVTQGYRAATTRDCRISWVTRLYLDQDREHVFLNRLLRWNLELWGCGGVSPPKNFGLLYTEVPLTSADAEVLIDLYMQTTITTLQMSSDEIDAMRAMLGFLANRVIERRTDELTDSHCPTGAGGAAGEP